MSTLTAPLYQPIGQDTNSAVVRVLDVDSASSFDDVIRGQLRLVDLRSEPRPKFSALSYTWGQANNTTTFMLCGTEVLPIQPNAHSALKYLRKSLGPFTIWIDSVCINQHDVKEKEQQIPLMGDIYQRADTVYVWLGEGNRSTSRAMEYLRKPPFLDYLYPASSLESGKVQPRPWSAALAYVWKRLQPRETLYPCSHECASFKPVFKVRYQLTYRQLGHGSQNLLRHHSTISKFFWIQNGFEECGRIKKHSSQPM